MSARGGGAGDGRDSGGLLLRALSVTALVLALAIAAGGVWGLATGSRARALARRAAEASGAAEGLAVFDRIGTVRARSADPEPAVIVATPSFPYPAGDRDFAEELWRKTAALRAATVAFLSTRTAEQLAPAYEGAVKAGLRDAWNGMLSLGEVGEVWLSDLVVVP